MEISIDHKSLTFTKLFNLKTEFVCNNENILLYLHNSTRIKDFVNSFHKH